MKKDTIAVLTESSFVLLLFLEVNTTQLLILYIYLTNAFLSWKAFVLLKASYKLAIYLEGINMWNSSHILKKNVFLVQEPADRRSFCNLLCIQRLIRISSNAGVQCKGLTTQKNPKQTIIRHWVTLSKKQCSFTSSGKTLQCFQLYTVYAFTAWVSEICFTG